jgi:hypothetical protein
MFDDHENPVVVQPAKIFADLFAFYSTNTSRQKHPLPLAPEHQTGKFGAANPFTQHSS